MHFHHILVINWRQVFSSIICNCIFCFKHDLKYCKIFTSNCTHHIRLKHNTSKYNHNDVQIPLYKVHCQQPFFITLYTSHCGHSSVQTATYTFITYRYINFFTFQFAHPFVRILLIPSFCKHPTSKHTHITIFSSYLSAPVLCTWVLNVQTGCGLFLTCKNINFTEIAHTVHTIMESAAVYGWE
jgi:hypothetical protein